MKLSPCQVRTITALVKGERTYISGPTANALVKAGLIVLATGEQVNLDSNGGVDWSPVYAVTMDAKRFAS